MKNFLFFFWLIISIHSSVFCQVNLQTGSATFSLPMFNWKDGKSRLNSVVGLNYKSGNGLKVNELASDIGQGWSLQAGGVITRMQVGEADDQKPRDGAENDVTKYPAGYLYNPDAVSLGCPEGLVNYPIFEGKNKVYKPNNRDAADRELDYFSFQFNGRSGLFILNADNTGTSVGDSKLKIWFTRNESAASGDYPSRTTINAFYIQDENGLIYTYSTLDLTKILKSGYTDKKGIDEQNLPNFKKANVYYQKSFDKVTGITYSVAAWHLTEIKDALTGRAIKFNYSYRNVDALGDIQLMYFKEKDYAIVAQKSSKTRSPVLSSIIYPDGHVVTFNYEKPRVDLNGAFALTSVATRYKDRYISKYTLNSNYFILNRYGTPVTDYQKRAARLCLLSVTQSGVDLKATEKPYVFDYYIGSSTIDDFVPPPFYYCKDIWGYYNGDNSKTSTGNSLPSNKWYEDLSCGQVKGLCFLRDDNSTPIYTAKSGYAKNGLLKEVTYPSGGTLSYEYEQNRGILEGQERLIGGVHISKINSTDGGFSNGDDHPLSTSYNYILDSSSKSSLWGLEKPVTKIESSGYYKPGPKKYKPLFSCKFKYQYPGLLSAEDKMSISTLQSLMQSLNTVLNTVGIAMQIKDIATILTASGVVPWAAIGSLAVSVIFDVIACFKDGAKTINSTIFYNADLNSANPLPMQFKRVEVTPQSGEVGKTVYTFTSETEYPLWTSADNNKNYSMRQRYANWAYGLPLKTVVYDSSGKKTKETNYTYNSCYSSKEYDPTPQWQAGEPAQKRCGSGNMAGHREIYMKDINPLSATYNTWQWRDAGIDVAGCPIAPPNLINNGDFEQGETGFNTEYTLVPYQSQNATGKVSVSTNPHLSNGLWCDHGDHTTGSGTMLLVDGIINDPGKSFWYTTVNVEKYSSYEFHFWAMNLYASNPPSIQLNINDSQVFKKTISATTCVWQEYVVTWYSGTNTVANLDLIDPLGITGSGNDFAIDDISFIKTGTQIP